MPQKRPGFHPTRDLIHDWQPRDSQKLADQIMAAGKGFPGGGGWQMTADQIERWMRDGDILAAHVTEDADRIVAVCNVMAAPGQTEHCYVPYLGCDPAYHGRKHGKSVLHAIVEWACRAGYRQVDLNTWAGNMKAVPLYKKTGFMWRPDTAVFMENYIPSALAHPLGQAYFGRHDWYATMERSLDLIEDDVKRGKVHVYEYLWRAGDEYLRMVFDRQSRRLIEIETPELAAACSLPEENLVAGTPHRVQWRLENKRPEPVQVFLAARGEPGVDIAHRESCMLSGAARLESEVTVDAGIAEKRGETTAAFLTSEVTVGDTQLELTNGIGVEQIVDVKLLAPRGVILPGEEQRVLLTLRSHLNRKATVRLELRAIRNVEIRDRSVQVEIGPRASAEVPVRLRAIARGAATLQAQASARVGRRRISSKPFDLTAVASGPKDLAGAVGEDTCILVGGHLTVFASRRHGQLSVHHRLRGERANRLNLNPPQIGPPFMWDDFFQVPGHAWVEEASGSVNLHLQAESGAHPGLVLDRRITLDRSPLVEVVDTITNGGAQSFDVSRRQFMGLRSRPAVGARWTVPIEGGPFTDYAAPGGRGVGPVNPPDDGDRWTEGWFACAGNDGVVSALIWDRAEVMDVEGYLEQKSGPLAAGRSVTLPSLHLLVTDGNEHTVRSWWQHLHGEPFGEHQVLPTDRRDPIELKLSPCPLIVAGDRATAKLSLQHPGRYILDGHVDIDAGERLHSDVGQVKVASLTRDNPLRRSVTVRRRRKGDVGSAEIGLAFDSAETIYHSRVPVLLLDRAGVGIEINEEDGLYTVSNGILTGSVAPAFMGAMTSLQLRGVEYLISSWPEGGQRDWRNPWHGGIHPDYGRLWGRLHKERFRGRTIRRRGTQGLAWEGVRVSCRTADERSRHHTLYIDYLMAPGVDVLALVVGRRNSLGEWIDAGLGFNLWSNLADAPGKGVFHTGCDAIVPQAGPQQFGDFQWDWGGLVSVDGRALFIGAGSDECRTSGWSGGPEGCILAGQACREVAAGATEEAVFFVAPTVSREEAVAREAWVAFEELP